MNVTSPSEPILATHVFVNCAIPANTRREWTRRRDFQCTCGFDGPHPMCQSCGLAIGPQHIQRRAGRAAFTVYADTLNQETGRWEVARQAEDRLVCAACYLRIQSGAIVPDPVRQSVRVRRRLVLMNAWRRKRKMPLLTEHSFL